MSPSNAVFLGLSLALRSHDQFDASHWSTLPRSLNSTQRIHRALKTRSCTGMIFFHFFFLNRVASIGIAREI